MAQLRERKQKLEGELRRLASTAAETGPSAFLVEAIHEREQQLRQITDQLLFAAVPAVVLLQEQDILASASGTDNAIGPFCQVCYYPFSSNAVPEIGGFSTVLYLIGGLIGGHKFWCFPLVKTGTCRRCKPRPLTAPAIFDRELRRPLGG